MMLPDLSTLPVFAGYLGTAVLLVTAALFCFSGSDRDDASSKHLWIRDSEEREK